VKLKGKYTRRRLKSRWEQQIRKDDTQKEGRKEDHALKVRSRRGGGSG
jgi:hypothetical protein